MIIYNSSGVQILSVNVNDDSYRYRGIMVTTELVLKFALTKYTEIPVGSYCVYQGIQYTLLRPADVTIVHRRDFEYSVTFEPPQGKLALWKFKDVVWSGVSGQLSGNGSVEFSLTGTPSVLMGYILSNLKAHDSSWQLGSVITGDEKVLTFSHNTILEALNTIAEEFDTEWEIVDKTVSLGKVEYLQNAPLAMSYGKGKGFRTGVKRNNDAELPMGRVYIQGSDRNINKTEYGNTSLLLPKNETFTYNGRTYQTDANGFSLHNTDSKYNSNDSEGSLDLTHIYPSHVGTVTAVRFIYKGTEYQSKAALEAITGWTDDCWDEVQVDIIDEGIKQGASNAIDFGACRIPGEVMYVHFESGELTGQDFDIMSTDDELTGFVYSEGRFMLVAAEIDGMRMPGKTFVPAIGNKYIVFGCAMPQAYIEEAQDKMLAEAAKFLYENEDLKFSFSGEVDPIWAKANWATVAQYINPGYYIRFSDKETVTQAGGGSVVIGVQTEDVDIRITGVRDYINRPYAPELELSNSTISGGISSAIRQIDQNEVADKRRLYESAMYSKRRWRDVKETTKMLELAFDYYSESIAPVSVQTMQMLVGDESLQFRFVTSKVSPIQVDSNFLVSFNGDSKILTVAGGLTGGAMILQHMTLGVNTLSSTHDASEYSFWDISKYLSPALTNADAAYYIYAKVAKNGSSGDIVMSQTPIAMEGVTGFYHFLIGILNSEYEGTRSFAPMFGYTEILPGRVTTDRVCSADGVNFFDLVTGEFIMALQDNSQYIKFDGTNGVQINGKLTIGAGSSGIENLDGYTARQSEIDAAIEAVAGDLDDFADAVEASIQDLQDQIDDAITTWYYEGVPTLSNAPAVSWDTADKRQQHIGDLYYDKLTGFAYRFLLDGTTYKWVQIQDEAIAQALAAAAAAQDTADGKRTTYFSETAPTGVTLSIGDLWTDGDVLKVWNGTAWVDSNTYASQAMLSALSDSFEQITDGIKAEMEEMQEAISRMNDDSVFDNDEKSYIRTLWENINGKASLLETGAGTYLQTKQLAEDCGADTGLATKLKFDGNPLYFDDEEITFWVIGLSQLDGAYMSLRDYLREVNLYLSQPTDGFDREYLADLFTTYYKAEQALVSYSANCYAESFCESTLQEFIDGEYATDLAEVQTQLDGKAETYYLPANQDPSAAWTTTELKELHLGDIWMNTTPDSNGNTHTYIYRKKNNTYGWEEVNGVPTDVFDMADGKASIYTAKPTAYKKNDMWILESSYTLSGVSYAAGTIVVAKNDSNNGWAANDWTKKDKYTDDTALTTFLDGYSGTLSDIRTQIDKKAETWYQSSDPSTAWTDNDTKKEHVGDIWMDTSANNGKKTYIYRNNGSAASPNYGWVAQDVPTEVFDKIDGKAAIYVTWNAWVVSNVSQLRLKDIFIPASDTTQGGVTYKANAFYRCTSTNPVAFQELKYTDDAALTAFVQNTYEPFVEAIGEQMDAKADTFVQSTDPSSAWNTTDLKDLHVGDMWLNTNSASVSGIGSFKTAIYTKSGSTYSWVQTEIPNAMFDQIDGKSSVYVAKPTSGYHARDLWILEQAYVLNGVAYRQGTILCATTTSQTFNAAHWVKKDAYIDTVDFTTAIADLESEISQMNATLSDINDDSVLDVTEKGYIRTLWEAINGLPSLSQIGDGSYMKTKNIIDTQGAFYESVVLLFHNKHLYFHDGSQGGAQFELGFYYAGVAELDNAFYALRSFLQDANLYSDVVSRAFNRENMANLFTDFYNAAQNVMQREIADARSRIDRMADDGYISAPEKRALKSMAEDEAEYYAALVAKADLYADDSSSAKQWQRDIDTAEDNYKQAYIAYVTTINYYTAAATWEDDIPIITTSGVAYSWAWITAYYDKRKLLEEAIDSGMKTKQADFDYLVDALPDGAQTELGDGVVLSQVIGVKEAGTNNVVAGMNGSASIPDLNDSTKGRLMIWAGSSQVSYAKNAIFQVWEDGTLVAKQGQLEDLLIKKTRNPFSPQSSSGSAVDDDTIYTCASGDPSKITIDGHMEITMDWTAASNGRRIIVVGSAKFRAHATAPDTHKYIVNGRAVTSFQTSYEVTELIGLGRQSVSYWLVVNRQIVFCERNYGRDLRALAFGHVTGSSSGASLSYESAVQNSAVSPTIADADKMYATRVETGVYRLWMPTTWFVSSSAIFCMACGRGAISGGTSTHFANVYSYGQAVCPTNNTTMYYVEIRTADDSTLNDGSFNFILYNTYGWHD